MIAPSSRSSLPITLLVSRSVQARKARSCHTQGLTAMQCVIDRIHVPVRCAALCCAARAVQRPRQPLQPHRLQLLLAPTPAPTALTW